MKRSPFRVLVTAVVALAICVPASAQTFVPVLESEQVFFRCSGRTRLSQAELARSIGWTTEPPAASLAQGGGCGSHDSQLCCPGTTSNNNYIYDAVFAGDVEGNLDTLTVKAWMFDAGAARTAASHQIDVYLAVDGRVRVDNVPIQVPLAPTDAARPVEFTVTGLNLLSEADATAVHTVDLVMKTPLYSGTDLTWLFDATEVPSGITFNPAEAAAISLKAR